MKVLVVGGGGREHALAWKVAQSPRVAKVFVAPGNAGTAADPNLINVPIVDIATLVAFAKREAVALTIVGPEGPLAAGIVDAFTAAGLRIFGPTQAAARLESSKDFAKAFMAAARHSDGGVCERSPRPRPRMHSSTSRGAPIVVKADGLAAGKGVVVAMREEDAHAAIDAMLPAGGARQRRRAGGHRGIPRRRGGELHRDGRRRITRCALASSQDHKRLGDGDSGPNTGGMGAYSPAPVVTPTVHARIMREVIAPAIAGMAAEGMPYTGFLYAGVMIDDHGAPRVLEFNCRLGDPETQPILTRLNSDLIVLVDHALAGTLDRVEAEWDRRAALTSCWRRRAIPTRRAVATRSKASIESLPLRIRTSRCSTRARKRRTGASWSAAGACSA